MNRIIIIEDDSSLREELVILLKNSGYEVIIIEDYDNIPEQINVINPDLILLDIGLPGKDGYDICKEIRATSNVPIIFITSHNDTIHELKALSFGGDDFISKPYNIPVLLARIATILRRNSSKQDNIINVRGFALDISKSILEYKGKVIELTKNENRILSCLCKNPGEIVSRSDIIEFLWDNDTYIDDNTLSVNITRLRDKLKQIGLADLIKTKRGMGYRI